MSEDVMAFTRASLEWAERSGGAFDATGGPLFDLWNRVRKNENVPTGEAIPDCMDTVGYDKVRVTENTVFLTEPGMRLARIAHRNKSPHLVIAGEAWQSR